MGRYVGVDIGGTKIAALLADEDGAVFASLYEPTRAWEGQEAVFGRVAEAVAALLEASGDGGGIRAIGVGAPGPIDARTGTILVTENLPFVDFPIASLLAERFGIPTYLDNDGNAGALGEYLYGAGRGADPFVYLTASTGIGAGAVLGGRLLRGRSSNALEIGHCTLLPDGPPCACGKRGCVEALASGAAIAARAVEARRAALEGKGPATALTAYDPPTAADAFREAERGDGVAAAIVGRAIEYLGICVANLVTIFDPEVMAIGGGLARSGERLLAPLREAVLRRCPEAVAKSVRIVPALLGEASGALGAAALAVMESGRAARC